MATTTGPTNATDDTSHTPKPSMGSEVGVAPALGETQPAKPECRDGGGGGGGLYGLTTVQKAFHFLPDPADVLRAATACRRWRELACADSVWRARFEREGLVDKARLFEVALPAVEDGEGGGSSSSSSNSAAASERDELAGVGLAFYAQVFALEVRGYYAACAAERASRVCTFYHCSHPLLPPAVPGVQDEG